MKKKVLLVAVLLAMVIVVPSLVMASTVRIGQGSYSSGSGGEFYAYDYIGTLNNDDYKDGTTSNLLATTSGATKPSFQTFCLEGGEFFNPGSSYTYNYNYKAVEGGVGSAGDPISQGTSWLYSQFAKGSLAGYLYTGTDAERRSSAGTLQNMIWHLENEIGGVYDENLWNLILTNPTITDPFASAVVGEFGVFVLNLTSAGGLHQDMLFYDANGSSVPIPPTFYLLGAGLLGLVGLRRKFRK